jgi:hypothetical protein
LDTALPSGESLAAFLNETAIEARVRLSEDSEFDYYEVGVARETL